MYKIVFFLLLQLPLVLTAQQTAQFSNYLFNSFGINPAGVSRTYCNEIKMGRREQWIGFNDGPVTTFLSGTRVLGNIKQRNNFHVIGIYLEQDGNRFLKNISISPAYSYHLRVYKDYFASFGVFVGSKIQTLSTSLLNAGDHAFLNTGTVFAFPDISVGMRLASKTIIYDLAIKQIYTSYLGTPLGLQSKLSPHLYFTYSRKIESKSYFYTYLPSFQVRYGWSLPPSVDLSFMMFTKGKIGFGLSYRYNDAVTGLVHINIRNKFSVALSFDYILSEMRTVSFYSREYMAGVISCSDKDKIRSNYYCPAYEK